MKFFIGMLFSASVFAQDSAYVQSQLDKGGAWNSDKVYTLETAVFIRQPIKLSGMTFNAHRDITETRLAMIYAGYLSGVTLRDVTIDGNISERAGAWYCDGTNNAYHGGNIHFDHVDDVVIDGVTTRNAVCGSGMHFSGKRARIINSNFIGNGTHTQNQWADGLTLLNCDFCIVADNLFADNTDVGLVFGGGRNTLLTRNTFRQSVDVFAALALDNFNGTQSGDFTGTIVSGNTIDCAMRCDFGINIGPHAWYLSANTIGGRVSGNQIFGGKIGIMVGGAGTIDAPVSVYGNDIVPVLNAGDSATFSCGDRVTYPIIVSPDSYAVLRGETVRVAYHRQCP